MHSARMLNSVVLPLLSSSSSFPAWSARLTTPRRWRSGPRCTFRFGGFFTYRTCGSSPYGRASSCRISHSALGIEEIHGVTLARPPGAVFFERITLSHSISREDVASRVTGRNPGTDGPTPT